MSLKCVVLALFCLGEIVIEKGCITISANINYTKSATISLIVLLEISVWKIPVLKIYRRSGSYRILTRSDLGVNKCCEPGCLDPWHLDPSPGTAGVPVLCSVLPQFAAGCQWEPDLLFYFHLTLNFCTNLVKHAHMCTYTKVHRVLKCSFEKVLTSYEVVQA